MDHRPPKVDRQLVHLPQRIQDQRRPRCRHRKKYLLRFWKLRGKRDGGNLLRQATTLNQLLEARMDTDVGPCSIDQPPRRKRTAGCQRKQKRTWRLPNGRKKKKRSEKTRLNCRIECPQHAYSVHANWLQARLRAERERQASKATTASERVKRLQKVFLKPKVRSVANSF